MIHIWIISLLWLVSVGTITTTYAFTITSNRAISTAAATTTTSTTTTSSTTTTAAKTSTLLFASSQEEDLELTRKIIRQHEERLSAATQAASQGGTTPTMIDGNDDDDDDATSTVTSKVTTPSRTTTNEEDRPKNDLMIRAAFGEPIDQTPVWLFRQAGRHLPEYEQYKQQTQRNFLQLLQDPSSVAECTLQPIRRYNVDAAILFSDILVIAEALNVEVTMPGGVGIQVPHPLQSPEEVSTRLPSIKTVGTPQFIQEKLGHVMEAIRQIRIAMKKEDKSIPLIGFSAAPWTLMYYMVGGSVRHSTLRFIYSYISRSVFYRWPCPNFFCSLSLTHTFCLQQPTNVSKRKTQNQQSKKNTEIGVQWLTQYPEASQSLLQLLTAVIIEYLSAQVQAGVHMLQIFEAMGMMIDDTNFQSVAMPCLQQIAVALKERHPTVPLMIFCRGACHMNDQLTQLGYHVITMDGSVDRSTARTTVGPHITLQGNYDPSELIAANGKSVDTVRDTARTMLQELGPQRLIANLGEGLGGKESPELVEAFVNAIHEESAAMILQEQQLQQQQQQQR